MLHIGIGQSGVSINTKRKHTRAGVVGGSGGGGGGATLLAAGSTWGWIGDGLQAPSGGSGTGIANPAHQFMRLIGGRLQPVPVPIMARSGSTIAQDISSNRAWIKPYAIDAMATQVPDVFIFGTCGANDNILSTNPGASAASGATTNVYLQDWYDAVAYAYGKFTAYNGKLFVVCLTASSTKTNESTYRPTVWAAMIAHIAAMTALDSKVVLADISDMTDATQWSVDSGSSYTHLDERGAYHLALAVFNAIDAKIESKTNDEVRDMIAAGTYPLITGSQLDSDETLAGSGGTVTGPGITGTLATSLVITNTSGATGITVAQTSTSSGRTKTVVTLAGTASGDGKVMLQDKNNLSFTGTPGQQWRTGAIVRMPANIIRNAGADLFNTAGFWGGTAVSLIDNTRAGANETHAIDALLFYAAISGTSGTLPFGSSTTFTGKRSLALFVKSGQALSGAFEMERPFAYRISNRTAAAPAYIGDTKDSNNSLILNTNWRLRPTGTISQAAGGTIRVEPGSWNLFGLTEADFVERRIYKGTVSDTAVGSGTLIATLSGSTWTNTFGAAAVTTGDRIFVEVDCNNGVGSTVTARSGVTVTAT